MYRRRTRDIDITVLPQFADDQSQPDFGRFFWVYTVEIVNQGQESVQLMSRHWIITDANGDTNEVRGPGVVGEQPVIEPGGVFRYSSGCPLPTPSGIMRGTYRVEGEDGEAYDVEIPAFSLDSPYMRRVLN